MLTDPYYPGWRSFVDGAEVELLRANYLFRAVALPPGEHEVVFRFDPASLRLGATISIVALALAAALIAVGLGGGPLTRWIQRRRSAQIV